VANGISGVPLVYFTGFLHSVAGILNWVGSQSESYTYFDNISIRRKYAII